jgi:hypothetical protein
MVKKGTLVKKRWECLVCLKKYCYLGRAYKHNRNKHEFMAKFKEL